MTGPVPGRTPADTSRPEKDVRPGTLHNTATCTGPTCGATIRWAVTREGRRLPLNPDPDPAGNVVIETNATGEIRARILTGPELPAQGEAWMPHWKTCPDSPVFQRLQRATQPRCRACRGRLDPWLVANGWHHHVLCAPLADFRAYVQAAREKRTA